MIRPTCVDADKGSSSVTKGLRVALVEGMDLEPLKNWKPETGTYSNRVSSLTPGSVEFLGDIGVWEHVKRERVQTYTGMQVWSSVAVACETGLIW